MRRVAWFSCGAASALAVRLALKEGPLEVVYCAVAEEHPDNLRFLADFEATLPRPVTVLRNAEYNGSIFEVFRRRGYINGVKGAPCSRLLKKGMRESYQRPGDVQVLGFCADEADRAEDFVDRNEGRFEFPLIEAGIKHSDTLWMVERLGLRLPEMYRLGYGNANCVGCVKGGKGYWNKIREDFPERFQQFVQLEADLGYRVMARVSLADLKPGEGRHESIAMPSCGVFCESTMQHLELVA